MHDVTINANRQIKQHGIPMKINSNRYAKYQKIIVKRLKNTTYNISPSTLCAHYKKSRICFKIKYIHLYFHITERK